MEEVQKGQRGGPVCKCLRTVVFNEEEVLQTWEGHRGGPLHFMNLNADMNIHYAHCVVKAVLWLGRRRISWPA